MKLNGALFQSRLLKRICPIRNNGKSMTARRSAPSPLPPCKKKYIPTHIK